MKFQQALAQFGIKAIQRSDKVRRASIIELFNLVIMSTPVDTGRLRGNWQTMVNSPNLATTGRVDKTGSTAKAEVLANLGSLVDVVYMTNNLPYAERIEYEDWSAKAPGGMLRKNVARWPEIVAAKAKGYSDG